MRPRRLAAIAFLLYLGHVPEVLVRHPLQDLLWACDAAALALSAGLALGSARVVAASTIALLAGLPLWVTDLLTGGEWLWTSPFIHLGSPAVGLIGLKSLGVPRFSGLVALGLVAAVTLAARLAGAPAENVNLAFATPDAFTRLIPSHALDLSLTGALVAAECLVAEAVLRRELSPA